MRCLTPHIRTLRRPGLLEPWLLKPLGPHIGCTEIRVAHWRTKGAGGFNKPTLPGLIARYVLLVLIFILSVGPFLRQLSTSVKGPRDQIYDFPPKLIPTNFTFDNYVEVSRTIPILDYALHSR